jgi:hypothetical protein
VLVFVCVCQDRDGNNAVYYDGEMNYANDEPMNQRSKSAEAPKIPNHKSETIVKGRNIYQYCLPYFLFLYLLRLVVVGPRNIPNQLTKMTKNWKIHSVPGSCRARSSAAYVNSALGSGILLAFTSLSVVCIGMIASSGSGASTKSSSSSSSSSLPLVEGEAGKGRDGRSIRASPDSTMLFVALIRIVASFLVRATVLARHAQAHPFPPGTGVPAALLSFSTASLSGVALFGSGRGTGTSRSRCGHHNVLKGSVDGSRGDWATGIPQQGGRFDDIGSSGIRHLDKEV